MAEKKDQATAVVPADPTIGADSEAEQVAAAAASARPARKAPVEAPTGKGRATPKQTTPGEREHKRATPVQFVKEVVAELQKVVWPTWDQLRQYFVVVLVFVLIMIAIVLALDLAFGAAILKWLG